MTTTNKRYLDLRVMAIGINVYPTGDNPTNTLYALHAQSMYGPQQHVSH
jgi:hypothetical protein